MGDNVAQDGVWVLAIVGVLGLVAIVILGAAHSEMKGKSRRCASGKSSTDTNLQSARAAREVGARLLTDTGESQKELLSKNLQIPPPDEARIEAVSPKNERPRRLS